MFTLKGEFASPEIKGSLDVDEDIGVDDVSSTIDGVFNIAESNVESIVVLLGVGEDDDLCNAATDEGINPQFTHWSWKPAFSPTVWNQTAICIWRKCDEVCGCGGDRHFPCHVGLARLANHDTALKGKGPKATKLMSNLTNVMEVKKRRLEEMEGKYMETKNTISKLIAKNDKLQQSYYEEVKEMQFSIREHFQWICNDHEMNQLAIMEQKKAEERMLKLAEDQKREKEKLHDQIIELQKKLDDKQRLELEIRQMKGALKVMEHMTDSKKKRDLIQEDLKEKEEELEDLEALNKALIIKGLKSNDELVDARKELFKIKIYIFYSVMARNRISLSYFTSKT
ncbi:hypothetical protein Tco_0478072 [Tanacetum coccineum]